MKARLTLAFALLLVGTGVLAQTPDGLPPAGETVCDNESGAAYGLCNAYCEAMDCELANDSNPNTEPNASATACSKVRSKFQNITGRDIPCEVSCPCTSIPEFNAQLAGANSCIDFGHAVYVSTGSFVPIPGYFFFEAAASFGHPVPNPSCGYFNLNTSTHIFPSIASDQAAVCLQIMRDAIASRGLTCESPF